MDLRGRTIGRWRVAGELARGGQGVVLDVRDDAGRRGALKLLLERDPEAERRFHQEARVLEAVAHPHLVRLLDRGDSPAGPYLVMERVEGRDLRAVVEEGGPLEAQRAAALVAAVADCLEALHARGVVHRDLKPENVLVEAATGRVVVVDLGLVRRDRDRLAFSTLDRSRLTVTGEVLGTPAFMAPEQVDPSAGAISPRTDVHALGALLAFLLTGRAPFSGRGVYAVLRAVTEDDPPDVARLRPGVPRPMARLCRAALAKAPADRPPSAAAFAAALRAEATARPRRAAALLAGAVVALGALAALGVVAVAGGAAPPAEPEDPRPARPEPASSAPPRPARPEPAPPIAPAGHPRPAPADAPRRSPAPARTPPAETADAAAARYGASAKARARRGDVDGALDDLAVAAALDPPRLDAVAARVDLRLDRGDEPDLDLVGEVARLAASGRFERIVPLLEPARRATDCRAYERLVALADEVAGLPPEVRGPLARARAAEERRRERERAALRRAHAASDPAAALAELDALVADDRRATWALVERARLLRTVASAGERDDLAAVRADALRAARADLDLAFARRPIGMPSESWAVRGVVSRLLDDFAGAHAYGVRAVYEGATGPDPGVVALAADSADAAWRQLLGEAPATPLPRGGAPAPLEVARRVERLAGASRDMPRDQAERVLRAHAEAFADDPGAQFGLGVALLNVGAFAAAEAVFGRVLAAEPGGPRGWVLRADLRSRRSEVGGRRARDDAERAVSLARLGPDANATALAKTLSVAALVHVRTRDDRTGAALAAEAIELAARRPEAVTTARLARVSAARGAALDRLGRPTEAVAAFGLAARTTPLSVLRSWSLEQIAALLDRGDDALEAARAALREVVAATGDPEAQGLLDRVEERLRRRGR